MTVIMGLFFGGDDVEGVSQGGCDGSLNINQISIYCGDPDLCRNTMKYRNTHKRRDAAEIILHFINNKGLNEL